MTSTILSNEQKAALYDLRFSPEEIMLLNKKPELVGEIICNPFLIYALGHQKIIALALTKPSIFSDIKALLDCKFSQQHILYLLQIDKSGELLRPCLNHARRLEYEGIFSKIGHKEVIKIVRDQQNGHRILWGHSLGVANNAPQEESKKSLLLQTIPSLPQQSCPLEAPFDKVTADFENFLTNESHNAPIPAPPVFSQQTDTEWLAASGYNNQQIVDLVNHPSRETFITALKNLHHNLITEFTHEEIVVLTKNYGVIILDMAVQLRDCGFRKQIILSKLESLNKYAPMLLKEQFKEDDLIDLLLEDKGEFLLELLTKAHPFLTEVLGFTNHKVKLLAKSSDFVEKWEEIQHNYHSLIALGITKKELSRVATQGSCNIALALLEHHIELDQLGFSPKDMIAIAKQTSGVKNIEAVLNYRQTPHESSFTNSDLIKITARNGGDIKLSTISLYYKKLHKMDFSHGQIVDLASYTLANIEIIAQGGVHLRKMNFTLFQMLEILTKFKGKKYLQSIISNRDFLRTHKFQSNELFALAKIPKGYNIIHKIREYSENIHQYIFPLSKENLVSLLTAENGVQIFEAINKYQDTLSTLGFTTEELLSNFVYMHSFAYLTTIALCYSDLQQLGFKKNHIISLASKSQAVILLNAVVAVMKSLRGKQLLHTTSIEQVIDALVLESESTGLVAKAQIEERRKQVEEAKKSKASRKRKIAEVKEPAVQSHEENKKQLIKAIKQLFPDENIKEIIAPIQLVKSLLVGIPCSMYSEFVTIEIINDNFYRVTHNKELSARNHMEPLTPKRMCFGTNPHQLFTPPAPKNNPVGAPYGFQFM
jgi:hypothetical protein